MNFQVTVLKILVSYPDGFAVMEALYADKATLDCCDGKRFVGRSGLLRYWPGKLRSATAAAFELDELLPEKDCVRLDYRDYDSGEVRTKFWFNGQGNTPQRFASLAGGRARNRKRLRACTLNPSCCSRGPLCL
ncbi:hypothetical protein IVB18_45650 [Bradyrhizobium sp. 186]|uniref:hypothetical protein n=1 Tax=Bradyrhizobium sp. 186 TaxID=2782654 RepID=UPI0020011147|nr:hypothetical protein [Bradyrhizobium sp. 186]UPK40743.1 hypothetical protein IVB18_45650 [Bradyrhizobium sp. 186]